MPASDEPRYTLDEARALLAEQDCRADGHQLLEMRQLDGRTLWVYCDRCPARFVPADAEDMPWSGPVLVHDGVAYPVTGAAAR